MLISKKMPLAIAAALAVTGLGGFTVNEAMAKDVTVTVDGERSSTRSYGATVADVLREKSVGVGEHDVIMPSLNDRLADGQEISVLHARKLTLTIDGKRQEIWTTATTVDEALKQHAAHLKEMRLSTSRSAEIGREGMALTITTPADVTIKTAAGSKKIQAFGTVADALKAAGVATTGAKITPAPSTPVRDGMTISVVASATTTQERTVPLAFKTKKIDDSDLLKGKEKVIVEGRKGVSTEVWEIRTEDGKKVSERRLSASVSRQPVDEVIHVGTKEPEAEKPEPKAAEKKAPEPEKTTEPAPTKKPAAPKTTSAPEPTNTGSTSGLDLRRMSLWNKIAYRESKCNWNINTGNGYYGGLQFAAGTWNAMGGTKYAPRADLATKAQQITIANKLYDRAGIQPWARVPSGPSC